MTPGEQIALMKVIETLDACENQDPTPKDLTVNYNMYRLTHEKQCDTRIYLQHSATSPRASIFTALHGMQTQSSDENSVCPPVCLSATEL